MKTSFRILLFIGSLILVSLVSWYLGYRSMIIERKTEIKQEVLLERIREVLKLGTAEGVFSEIYSYSDYYYYDISPFRKKALIRVRARVVAGFELDSIAVKLDYAKKTVILENIPQASILSIEHELDYYDISEGTFNSFSAEDHTMLQKQTLNFIRKKAGESDLIQTAGKQWQRQLELLGSLLAETGWKIEIKERPEKNFWN